MNGIIMNTNVELLAQATDSTNLKWTLVRCGHVYVLNLEDTDQTSIINSGKMYCPFTPDPNWLPRIRVISMFISQKGHVWNVCVDSNSITGWTYVEENYGQRFGEVVWMK